VKEKIRCHWATSEVNIPYHDEEWGVPVHDDRTLFEFLILEGAQAGLSWDTILRKRARYLEVFDNFDVNKIVRYDAKKVRVLLQDPGIIRNRLKIASTIGNAREFLKVQEEFGSFDAYLWRFVDGKPKKNVWKLQGFAETRVPFCWFDDLLCVHAGDRYGERPRRRMLPLPPDCKALRKDFDVDDVEGLRPCAANAMSVGLALRLVESNLSGNDRGWRAPIAAHQLGMRFVAAQRDA